MKILNMQEDTQMVLSAAQYLDDETILRHLPFLSPDEIDDILARKDEEEAERYEEEEEEEEQNQEEAPNGNVVYVTGISPENGGVQPENKE